ncbi:hypothetical protein AND_003770 [Anopheles darlingi]|uniref:Uncharacterized protein n=1 Tax=Anopheles darlingi TaxID=43151 RepID=W5JJD9_ANODA|nr:hypothetical protein AND_003770 [Anopheles darlingi]
MSTGIQRSVAAVATAAATAATSCWNRCPPGLVPVPAACQLHLTVQRLVRNESLVLARIGWSWRPGGGRCDATGRPGRDDQCLVTWEVSGGGLMGNLLTEATSNAELSLWTDTSYRVQVTCRDKHTSSLVRSAAALELNTSTAVTPTARPPRDPQPGWLTEIAEGDDDESLAAAIDASHPLHRRPPASAARAGAGAEAGGSSRELLLLAGFVALLLLLLLASSVLVVRWRPGGTTGGDPGALRDVLVENELLVDILHV